MVAHRPAWLREVVLLDDPRAGSLTQAAQGSLSGDLPSPSVLLGLHCPPCGQAVAVLLDAGHSLDDAAVAVQRSEHCLHATAADTTQ